MGKGNSRAVVFLSVGSLLLASACSKKPEAVPVPLPPNKLASPSSCLSMFVDDATNAPQEFGIRLKPRDQATFKLAVQVFQDPGHNPPVTPATAQWIKRNMWYLAGREGSTCRNAIRDRLQLVIAAAQPASAATP